MTALRLVRNSAPLEAKRAARTPITVKLPGKQVELLIELASDQLFRREFIDPKMPGHKAKPDEVRIGKEVVRRLRLLLEQGCLKRAQP